jgi:hypothetical protein
MSAAALAALALVQAAPELGSSTVGMPVSVRELVLPGPELEVVPATDATPVIVRLEAVRPHGEHFRYDLVWYGLEPGQHDLGHFLRRKDGAAGPDLPPLPVVVRSLLAPGQVEPHRPDAGALPGLGGYRWVLAGAAAAWVLALLALLSAGRRRRARAPVGAPRAPDPAARLRALVAAAEGGALEPAGRAELELALIAHWKRRLGLGELEAAAALARLAAHPEAGPLLAGLEDWLHRPGRPDVDLARLLAPYRELGAEAADPQGGPEPTEVRA